MAYSVNITFKSPNKTLPKSCVNDTYQLIRETVISVNDPGLGTIVLEVNPKLLRKLNILVYD